MIAAAILQESLYEAVISHCHSVNFSSYALDSQQCEVQCLSNGHGRPMESQTPSNLA